MNDADFQIHLTPKVLVYKCYCAKAILWVLLYDAVYDCNSISVTALVLVCKRYGMCAMLCKYSNMHECQIISAMVEELQF